jgi:hypothetical protein
MDSFETTFETTFETNFDSLVSSKLEAFGESSVPHNEDYDLGQGYSCVIA